MEATIDLNSDLGETVDGVPVAEDAAMFPFITSANIACGFHAGDESSMRSSCTLAVENSVAVGAHVSYRDRAGFGRSAMEVSPDTLIADVHEQLRALALAAAQAGTRIRYVKPHGALYNRIAVDRDQADAVASAVRTFDPSLPLLGLPGSAIADAATEAGLHFRREAFADRGYRGDGSLVPRSAPGALLHDPEEVVRRALRIVREGTVDTVDGATIQLSVDSLCVHGDTPGAVAMAAAIRSGFDAEGIAVAAFA